MQRMQNLKPMKSIFEPTEYLSLVLSKLDTELGLAQPQLVLLYCVQILIKMSSRDSLDQFFSFWSHFSRIDPSISEPLIISWHNFF